MILNINFRFLYKLGGPIWIDNINNFDFVQKIYNYLKSPEYDMELSSLKKINGLLGGILNVKLKILIRIKIKFFKGKRS